MNGLSEWIDSLEVKFSKLHHKIVVLENKNKELQTELEKSKILLQTNEQKIAILEEQTNRLKTVNTLLGSEEDKRETKLKINSLIREIDYCIAQLSE